MVAQAQMRELELDVVVEFDGARLTFRFIKAADVRVPARPELILPPIEGLFLVLGLCELELAHRIAWEVT